MSAVITESRILAANQNVYVRIPLDRTTARSAWLPSAHFSKIKQRVPRICIQFGGRSPIWQPQNLCEDQLCILRRPKELSTDMSNCDSNADWLPHCKTARLFGRMHGCEHTKNFDSSSKREHSSVLAVIPNPIRGGLAGP